MVEKTMDIVERLRSPAVLMTDGQMISPVAYEAAAEIERLQGWFDLAVEQGIIVASALEQMTKNIPTTTQEIEQAALKWFLDERNRRAALKETK